MIVGDEKEGIEWRAMKMEGGQDDIPRWLCTRGKMKGKKVIGCMREVKEIRTQAWSISIATHNSDHSAFHRVWNRGSRSTTSTFKVRLKRGMDGDTEEVRHERGDGRTKMRMEGREEVGREREGCREGEIQN
jgi:hypothetical protein